ncbi:OAM dimerization domain-containing protein, partial [Nocardia salmonicida]|uniref:OAM dimerization domain-containing protein n=1 Tax=Nocardia salmonicida TaxID=53431 RepID=UPI0033CCFADD
MNFETVAEQPPQSPTIIRPYGDTTGDGMVQLSFTLPIAHDKVAEGAAAQLANKMGMDPAMVVHAKPMGPDFTFFVVYGRVSHLVDPCPRDQRDADGDEQ